MYDPSAFHGEVHKWKENNSHRVKINNEIFVNSDAAHFGSPGNRVLFISDIRTRDEKEGKIPGDLSVMENQDMQMEWVNLMNPAACSLKFRGAFNYMENGEEFLHFDYLAGELNVQAWAPPNSTELRLFAKRPYKLVEYSSQMLEECMAYFNQHDRLMNGNDMKLQEHIINRYVVGGASRGVTMKGVEAFRKFVSAYEGNRGSYTYR